jgi:HSP20 family protein
MANPLDLWSGSRLMKNPFREFARVPDPIDQLFNEVMNLRQGGADTTLNFSPSTEIVEDKDQYLLKFDIPGVNKDQVHISIDKDQVTVQAERKEEKKEDNRRKHVQEIYYGVYNRTFTLPFEIDEKKVDAKFENGVLTVKIPKPAERKQEQPKQIAIH